MLRILCYIQEKRFRKCHPSAYAALCTHRTCRQSQWRLQGEILEGTGVPGPQRCLNQTPSKGREAFAHRLPQEDFPPQPHTHSKKRDVMKTRQNRHMREEEKREGEAQFTQHRKRVRLDRKEKEITEIKFRQRNH